MRKFCVRWWVVNPLARWHAECDALSGAGITLRVTATPEEVREMFLWQFVQRGPVN